MTDALAGGGTIEQPTEDRPIVTCIVVAYNHARFVVEALESVRNQTYGRVQLVIVDDASVDDTARTIESWLERQHDGATFMSYTENRGLCRRLNDALAASEGEFVAYFSGDDWMEPDRFERQIDRMFSTGEATGVVYSDARRVGVDSLPLPEASYLTKLLRSRIDRPEGAVYRRLLERNFVPAPTALVRHESLVRAGPYDESLVTEDYDMWLRIAALGYNFAYAPGMLANYRILDSSLGETASSRIALERTRVLRKHLGRSEETDAVIRRRIGALARLMYVAGNDRTETGQALATALRVEHRAQNLAFLVAQRAGMSYSMLRRLKYLGRSGPPGLKP